MRSDHAEARKLAFLFLAFVVGSCHPYNDTYYTAASRDAYNDAGLVSPIVEFDDDGYMRAPQQLDDVLAAMDSSAGTPEHPNHPVVVLVFIHGWHNNATLQKTGNLKEFNDFSRSLQQRLQSDSTTSKTTVLPVYFAWRGQNTYEPRWYNTYVIPWIAQYLTFFSRKQTAERIGRGELETALARISRKWHGWRNSNSALRQNYLVVAGHSFGGAALLTATLPQLVGEQEVAIAKAAARKANASVLRTSPRNLQDSMAPADLLIAVNPAIEASMIDRTVLAKGAPFAIDGSHPQLLVLDADNDGARKFWFKLGQDIGNATHVRTPHTTAENRAVAKLPGQARFSLSKSMPVLGKGAHLCDTILAGKDSLRLVALDERSCTNTVMVVQTHEKIIDGHNGIWEPNNREFLIQFLSKQHKTLLQELR